MFIKLYQTRCKFDLLNKGAVLTKIFILKIIAALFFGVGFIGIFLPLLPTVPLWIVAAVLYLKSDPEKAQKIFAHKIFGKTIEQFVLHGTLSRPMKIKALLGLLLTTALTTFLTYKSLRIMLVAWFLIGCGALYIWTRKEGEMPPKVQ